ncbi:hypothetical protein SPOG_05036 [Schizosaccharomyces cryophilus OY26]|uniref:Uncharacterized protein n=1 Tax=Schizosaccharomyces cryophilus (strain OY26 / ATCC MYA-4695 / CBS 11777 / NBRC 106824 / NRRL Y48691) TaxID=653667 RepID=S9W2W3_SCHCR|nr:uncharacterized protein SPOG_05036 [Schizosaccharomyces cryophilus OY26]EPY52894.1 hypothetical protein SPOG_05036 [Schizosaccharomyces cryophilus OY26]
MVEEFQIAAIGHNVCLLELRGEKISGMRDSFNFVKCLTIVNALMVVGQYAAVGITKDNLLRLWFLEYAAGHDNNLTRYENVYRV